MENIKYTSDGRKVSIVGKLNSQETIVQEIFIVNGNEVPSGENFVVKSLHDSPAVSWKEKNLKDLEENYKKQSQAYDTELRSLKKRYDDARSDLTEKTKYLRKFIENASKESFDLLTAFLKGEIKYIIRNNYSPELVPFDKFFCTYDRDRLKLITIFGKDDGRLSWGLNSYSDGSGSNELFEAFTNKEDAVKRLQEIVDQMKQYHTTGIFELAKKYDLILDEEKVKEYKQRAIEGMTKTRESYEKAVKDAEDKIKEITKL